MMGTGIDPQSIVEFMQSYHIEIIKSLERFHTLSDEWNKLLSQSAAKTIFLSWEWLYSWAETYIDKSRELFILAVFDEKDHLVGIAPWYVSRKRVLQFLSYRQVEFLGLPETASDYIDVFITRGNEKDVAYRIYDFLLKEAAHSWDCLAFRDVPVDSPFFFHFLNRIEEEGKYAEISRGSICPVASRPPDGTDDPLLNVSPHRKKRFNREYKLLSSDGGIEYRSIAAGNGFTGALHELFAFHEIQKAYEDKRLYRFLEKFIDRCGSRDLVEIDLMSHQGRTIAGLFHLHYHDTISMYLMVTDKDFNPKVSIGNVLVGLSMKRAFEGKFSTFDFLKGSEPYKFSWANGMRNSLNIVFYGKRIPSLLIVVKRFLTHSAKIVLR